MTDLTAIEEAFEAGDLTAWRAALAANVKANPAKRSARLDFADALLVIGAYEKADTHYDLAGGEGPIAARSQLTQRLLRGLVERDAWWNDGAMPELADEPNDGFKALIAALIKKREAADDLVAAFNAAEETRGELLFSVNDGPEVDFRDVDDRMASFLEMLTPSGVYKLAPLAAVKSLTCLPIEHVSDLVMRRAMLTLASGQSGSVFLPMIYPHTTNTSDTEKLGRATSWHGENSPFTGQGHRCFLVGDDLLSMGELSSLRQAGASDG
ncbi:MAG: type VI secretion system accessory protein TagJ [Pseudomonadota bacterium]